MRTNFSLISLQFIRFNFKAFRLMNWVIIDNYSVTGKDKICIQEVFTSSKKLPLSFRNTRGKRTENKTFRTSLSGVSYNRLTNSSNTIALSMPQKKTVFHSSQAKLPLCTPQFTSSMRKKPPPS